VSASGFGRFGVLTVDSWVSWQGGSASENLGTSLMVQGGSIALTNVEVCSTWRGLQPFAYGAVFRDGAFVSSDGLVLCDNEGPGALHDSVSADHRGLVASSNHEAALWVQSGIHFGLDGAMLTDNGLSGIVAVASTDVSVRSSRIETTRQVTMIDPIVGEIHVGDGMQFVSGSAAGLVVENVTFDRNERVGLLLQLTDGTIPSGTVSGVVVNAEGTAFGALAQTATTTIDPSIWSSGITRQGAALVNDSSFSAPVDVLGAVAPMFFPPPEI
jgi:hypothetical protein